MVLLDVTPFSLGIETIGRVMTKLIPRNTVVPTKKSQVFVTSQDGETTVSIKIEVTFEVAVNGILNVRAKDKATKSRSITITKDKGRLGQEEIERMVKEAGEFAEDKKVKERIDAKNKLEAYTYNMKSSMNDKMDLDDKEQMESALEEALEWLDDDPNA